MSFADPQFPSPPPATHTGNISENGKGLPAIILGLLKYCFGAREWGGGFRVWHFANKPALPAFFFLLTSYFLSRLFSPGGKKNSIPVSSRLSFSPLLLPKVLQPSVFTNPSQKSSDPYTGTQVRDLLPGGGDKDRVCRRAHRTEG